MNEQQPIVVYGVNSPNVLKVVLMLEELNLPYTLRHVAVFKGEQFTPEFLRLNPLGKVPVMVDPALDRPLAESGAILVYLAEKHGALLPKESGDRYEVLQWLMVQMSSIGPMLGQYTHFSLLPEGTEQYAHGRYGAMAKRLYTLIDQRVADREWIAGGAYSIADVAIFPWAEYLERHRFASADFPAMQKWREVIAKRPAAVRARVRMHESFTAASQQTIQSASNDDLERFFGRTKEMPPQDFSAVKRMR
jgi:GST-like protein